MTNSCTEDIRKTLPFFDRYLILLSCNHLVVYCKYNHKSRDLFLCVCAPSHRYVVMYFFRPEVVKNGRKTHNEFETIRKIVALKYTEIHHYREYSGGPVITPIVLVVVSEDRGNSLLKLIRCWRLVCFLSRTNRIC